MKRIILPTDFSDNALNAIIYALRLFETEPCTFYLLNTYSPAAYFVGTVQMNSYSTIQLEQIAGQQSMKKLAEVEKKINKVFPGNSHTLVKISAFNQLTAEINSLVEAHNIDLIVMGTKGATGAKEIFIGTQTMFAIKNAKCPIIAVPANFAYETPKEILFPTDFKLDTKNKFLGFLKEFSENHISRINILNAYDGQSLNNDQKKKKDFLDSYFKTVAHIFHSIEGMDIVDAVEAFQIKHKINFLVMIHNMHSFFENLIFRPIINQIVYHTNIPFLVIPSQQKINS